MGERGGNTRSRSLENDLSELEEARALTLSTPAQQDDTWLTPRMQVPNCAHPNHHWAGFPVMEDEVFHREQMRLSRHLGAPRQTEGKQP